MNQNFKTLLLGLRLRLRMALESAENILSRSDSPEMIHSTNQWGVDVTNAYWVVMIFVIRTCSRISSR